MDTIYIINANGGRGGGSGDDDDDDDDDDNDDNDDNTRNSTKFIIGIWYWLMVIQKVIVKKM